MSKQLSSYLWIEKYRPESIKDAILPQKTKKSFLKFVAIKEIPNLLLSASIPGCGKTSIAKAICKDIDADYLYINASKDGGIDTLRDGISKFATVKSLSGKPKIVILDEADGIGTVFQQALRGFMEEFHHACRFILTCNYISKIIEPLRSRCEIIDFSIMQKDIQEEMKPKILKRLKGILDFEKIKYQEETIKKLIDTYYPDIRSMVKLLQMFSRTMEEGEEINDNIFKTQMVDKELYNLILSKKFTKAREHIIQNNLDIGQLYTDFYKNLIPMLEKDKQPQVTIILADYAYKSCFVADKELNLAACLMEVIGSL